MLHELSPVKLTKLRLLIVAVTFLFAVTVLSVWLVSRVSRYERPPCATCADIYASAEIPTFSICELSNNPGRYENKVIRIRARLVHDAGYIFLSDQTCGARSYIRAGFVESSGSCEGSRKRLSRYSGYETWYDGSATVLVVGSIGPAVNYHEGNGFNIECLESADGPEMGTAGRIFFEVFSSVYFTIGKVGGIILDRI